MFYMIIHCCAALLFSISSVFRYARIVRFIFISFVSALLVDICIFSWLFSWRYVPFLVLIVDYIFSLSEGKRTKRRDSIVLH